MTATPRYLVQLSSAEIAFLHALVQRQVRRFVAERPEGRGMDPASAPPELISLDRRLLARMREVSDDEHAYFGAGGRGRPEAARIGEEHAALEGAARDTAGAAPLAGFGLPWTPAPGGQASNVVRLHGASRRLGAVRAG